MIVAAIVLAGGRSARFGSDKLAAEIDGTSVLAATIGAVSAVASRVVVAGPSLPAAYQAGGAVALVRDSEPSGGPLVALANLLRSWRSDPDGVALVVGGDMPRLVPAVLRLLLDRLAGDDSIDAVLLGRPENDVSDKRQVLPLAIRVDPARRAAIRAVEQGDRSLQSFVDRLVHRELAATEWLALDPDARTLTDIDTRGDLDRLNVP